MGLVPGQLAGHPKAGTADRRPGASSRHPAGDRRPERALPTRTPRTSQHIARPGLGTRRSSRRGRPFSALGPGHGWRRRAIHLAAGLRSDDARRADPLAPAGAELEPPAPHGEPDRCLCEPLVQRLGGAGPRQRCVTRNAADCDFCPPGSGKGAYPGTVRALGGIRTLSVCSLALSLLLTAACTGSGPSQQSQGLPPNCTQTITRSDDVRAALDAAAPGSTVCFTGGDLTDADLAMTKSGTPESPIKLIADGAPVDNIHV